MNVALDLLRTKKVNINQETKLRNSSLIGWVIYNTYAMYSFEILDLANIYKMKITLFAHKIQNSWKSIPTDFLSYSYTSVRKGFIGICLPKGYGFSAILVDIRLRAVSFFLENTWKRTQNKKAFEGDCERYVGAAMPLTASR